MDELQVISFDYLGQKLSCPVHDGHHMIPVKTICEIIDVDFKTQDGWLKSHPFWSQLYSLDYTVGADNKRRKMNCLSIFDVDGWLHSIGNNKRREGSNEKQLAFLIWLRQKKLELYKSIQILQKEYANELELERLIAEKESEIEGSKAELKVFKADLETLEEELENLRKSKFNQLKLEFPEDN